MIKLSLIFFISIASLSILPSSNGFFQQIFNLGARSSNCLPWSLWSPCFSTKDYLFLFRFPGYCYYNSYGQQFVGNGGIQVVEQAYRYLQKVNASYTACGQCSYQISCSRGCQSLGPQVVGGNPAQSGFSTQLCEVEQSEACLVNTLETGGICQMWPPVSDVIHEPYGAKMIKDQLYAMRTTACITIGDGCYCCCLPYVPDQETKRCRIGLVEK